MRRVVAGTQTAHVTRPAVDVRPRPRGAAGGVPAGAEPPVRRWLALAVLCLSLLIVTLDNTVLNVALPTLVRELHATSTDLQWIVDGYVMVFAGLLLVAGSLADRVGRKRTFLAGLVAFAAGSAWAAFSGSVGVLIAARASMGIGGALIMPSTLAIITHMFSDTEERQRAIGLWAGTSGLGIALGPITGGLLLAHFWWGSVFLINVPIAALGVLCALPLVPESRNVHARRPDFAGAVLSIAALALVLWAIIEAPVRGWTAGRVLGSGVAGVLVLCGFVWWERHSTHPMLDLRFFRHRAFSAAVSSVGLVMFGLFGALFVLTQFLQFALGYSALQSGVRALPAAGAIAVVAPVSSLLLQRIGTRVTVAAGLVAIAGGLWQLSAATDGSTYSDVVLGMVLLGVGAGLAIPSATASVMGSVPAEHTGVGSATNGTFLQVGGALGVAVIGSLLNTRYQDRMTDVLAPYGLPHHIRETILGSLGGAQQVAADAGGVVGQTLARLARSAFIDGMGLGLASGAGVAAVAAVVAVLALPGRRPRGSRRIRR
jgi:EmrB/QacA subfamily drug resistance transporter